MRKLAPLVAALLLLSTACSSGDSEGSAAKAPSTSSNSSGDSTTTAAGGSAAKPTGDVEDCPAAFRTGKLEAGMHEDFESGGQQRSFHLLLPDDADAKARPLFVSLTGTVQEEQAFMKQSGIDQLPESGWVVVAPVRKDNGVVWGPWDAMRMPAQTQANPDETLVMDLIACLSARHAIDQERIFVGGISIGGTFVNYLLRRHSDLFAGGIVGSGNFILTEPADPQPLDDMTVVVAWGGEEDHWTGCPDGRMGEEYAGVPGCVTADFVGDASKASQYYASESKVRQVACTEDVGHIWIAHATSYWSDLLLANPKGTTGPVDLGDPPAPLRCSTDPYVRS